MRVQMKSVCHFVFVLTLTGALTACNNEPSSTSADSTKNSATSTAGILDKFKPAPKITIPRGTRFRVALIDGVGTSNSSPGNQFTASLSGPVIVAGKVVIDKGTKVRGRVVNVHESGRVKGRASIQLALTEIVMRNGKTVAITTEPFTAVAEATKRRDAGIIAGGAGIGTAIGAIAGGKKGAAIGAAIGGGTGTGTVLATKGKDLDYPPETRLSFSLASPVEI